MSFYEDKPPFRSKSDYWCTQAGCVVTPKGSYYDCAICERPKCNKHLYECKQCKDLICAQCVNPRSKLCVTCHEEIEDDKQYLL